jgi:hypothetical protein
MRRLRALFSASAVRRHLRCETAGGLPPSSRDPAWAGESRQIFTISAWKAHRSVSGSAGRSQSPMWHGMMNSSSPGPQALTAMVPFPRVLQTYSIRVLEKRDCDFPVISIARRRCRESRCSLFSICSQFPKLNVATEVKIVALPPIFPRSGSRDGSKAPLASGRPEKRAIQREIEYSERNSLVEDSRNNCPESGPIL